MSERAAKIILFCGLGLVVFATGAVLFGPLLGAGLVAALAVAAQLLQPRRPALAAGPSDDTRAYLDTLDRQLAELGGPPATTPAPDEIWTQPDPIGRIAPVLVIRRPRAGTMLARDGSSWLGGLPALGEATWPRDAGGRALHHLASLDMAALEMPERPSGLPRHGHLCFFAATAGLARESLATAVLHTTAAPGPVRAPADLPPLYGQAIGEVIPGATPDTGPRVFPRWPVDLHPLDVDPDSDAAVTAALREMFPKTRNRNIGPDDAVALMPAAGETWLWDSAQRYAAMLQAAADRIPATLERARQAAAAPGLDPDLRQRRTEAAAAMEKDAPALTALAREALNWTSAHDRWAVMKPGSVKVLHQIADRIANRTGGPTGLHLLATRGAGTDLSLDGAQRMTFAALYRADDAPAALLPPDLVEHLDGLTRLPGRFASHQMFGHGCQIQDAAEIHADKHLLLQLHADALMDWVFADGGVIQFWIAPQDLARQAWDRVTVTVEGH